MKRSTIGAILLTVGAVGVVAALRSPAPVDPYAGTLATADTAPPPQFVFTTEINPSTQVLVSASPGWSPDGTGKPPKSITLHEALPDDTKICVEHGRCIVLHELRDQLQP